MAVNLNDNDANSTQLEGKKLKGRGVVEGFKLDGRFLELGEESPAIQEGEPEQEEHVSQSYGRESKHQRDERLKRELAAIRQQQLALKKQGLDEGIEHENDPNVHLDEIEQGMILSRMKGQAVGKQQFKQDPNLLAEEHAAKHESENLRKTDMPIVSALLGGAARMLDFSSDIKIAEQDKAPPGSIAATKVEDVRSKEGLGVGV